MNFGKEMKSMWNLDENVLFLNHGSFGATPKSVLEAERKWEERLERNPVHFFLDEYPTLLRKTIIKLAAFVKADQRKIVLTENATTGISTVMKSLMPSMRRDFTIVYTSHVYPAVRKIIEYTAKVTNCRTNEVHIPFPVSCNEEIIDCFSKGFADSPGIAVIDHIGYGPGMVFPVKEMTELARSNGYMTLIDAAHAPGMLPLNIEQIHPDWYVGNCHKWMYAPKGCAFVWSDYPVQETMVPLTISHGFGEGYIPGFDWTGTRNPAPWLALGDAIDFYNSLGYDNVFRYNHNLALEGSAVVCDALGVKPPVPGDMLGFLAPVEYPGNYQGTGQESNELRYKFYKEHNTEVVFNYLNGKMWLRVSAQVYNEMADYVKLAGILKRKRQ